MRSSPPSQNKSRSSNVNYGFMHNDSSSEDSFLFPQTSQVFLCSLSLCLHCKTKWPVDVMMRGLTLSNCFFKRCQEFHELPICGSPCTCEITESLSSMCQNEAVPGLFHLPPTDVPQFRQNAWPKNPNTCCSSDWLLVTSKKVREWITLGSPHMTPKGCSLHFRLPASQTALSVQSFSW